MSWTSAPATNAEGILSCLVWDTAGSTFAPTQIPSCRFQLLQANAQPTNGIKTKVFFYFQPRFLSNLRIWWWYVSLIWPQIYASVLSWHRPYAVAYMSTLDSCEHLYFCIVCLQNSALNCASMCIYFPDSCVFLCLLQVNVHRSWYCTNPNKISMVLWSRESHMMQTVSVCIHFWRGATPDPTFHRWSLWKWSSITHYVTQTAPMDPFMWNFTESNTANKLYSYSTSHT